MSDDRAFRSSFPDFEHSGFRTGSWAVGKATGPVDLTPYHPTILHAFAQAARLEETTGITLLPDRPGKPEIHQSYRELYHLARRYASGYQKLGVRRGDRILLALPTCLEFVAAFLGATMVAAIPAPAYPPTPFRVEQDLSRLAHIANHSGAVACVTSKQIKPILGDLVLRSGRLRHLVTVEELGAYDLMDDQLVPRPEHAAFLQYTSGSTGRPKGVTVSQHNLVSNIHAIGQASEITRADRVCGWCPLYHDMGLIGTLLFAIYWRTPLVLMSPLAFLSRPSRWLRAISDHGITMSPAPNFGFGLCVKKVTEAQRKDLDLSTWRLAFNGAEPVNMATIEDFVRVYGPLGFRSTSMLPVYGLAESTLAVTFPAAGEDVRHEVVDRKALARGKAVLATGGGTGEDRVTLVSCGGPVPGHDVLVLDENGDPLPERELGHVVVSGPSVMMGYYDDPDATAAVKQGGWLWTGDLGYFSNGCLYVAGRAKDMIIVRGRNYYAEDIERSVETVEGVRIGGSVAFGVYDEEAATDNLIIVCETRVQDDTKRAALVSKISEAILATSGLEVDAVVLAEPGTVPKTSSGKRQRALCRDQYLGGRLSATKTNRLRLGLVFIRSQAGFLVMHARRLIGRQRPPE